MNQRNIRLLRVDYLTDYCYYNFVILNKIITFATDIIEWYESATRV